MFFLDEFTKKINNDPSDIALTDKDGARSITYKELDDLSDSVVNKLFSNGVKSGDTVIIILPRCSEYAASEIALLKMGCVIVPLIPEYPADRIDYIEKDCNASFVIEEDFFDGIENFIGSKKSDIESVDDNSRGMIIYTSGSTGNPKGVVYTRKNIDAEIIRKTDSVKGIQPLVFAASATMSFCVTVTEYFRNMALGGHVHIISDEVRSDASLLSEYYDKNNITSGFISPRILKNFESKNNSLKRVFTASEKIVNIYSEKFEIVNCYGQSETVGSVMEFLIDKKYDNTPIGKPVKGVEAIIVDPDGNEVPNGEEGQICLIGDLPCEYNNLPEQTSKTFTILEDGRTLTHTGDIGKKLPDGNVLYLNRNDWMIKIHGQRVEPGEIESVMNKVKGITGSIVKAFDNEDGTMLLCGFYTESEPVDKEHIKEALKNRLPHYMIPGTFVKMDAFPVNPNGKIDRKSISKPDLDQLKSAYEAPQNEIEEKICHAMERILGINQIGRNDNFIELGGNSINAVSLCVESKVDGIAPQIIMIGQKPSAIAKLLSENSFVPKPKLKMYRNVKKTYPISTAQKYQYELCKSYGKPVDVIDMTYFFRLDENVNIAALKKAIEDTVDEHPVYKTNIDVNDYQLITDDSPYVVKEVFVKADEFSEYRKRRYVRVRDLNIDPLFESEIIKVDDGSVYLFICLCHLIYDGKSINNFFDCITRKYSGKRARKEKASIFNLIEYESKVKKDKVLTDKALNVFDEQYGDLKPSNFFNTDEKYETGASKPILVSVSQDEIDSFLKEYGISILTLLECALEITVSEIFGENDFCYMNVYDGRANFLLNHSHGVFAKSVFMRSNVNKYDSLKEYFEKTEEEYQKLVYYDVIDTFDVVDKYPAVKSGITFNYRDLPSMSITLGDNKYKPEFLSEFYEINKPFTDFDFIVNKLPAGYGYNAVLSSAKVSEEFAQKFLDCFDSVVKKILKGEMR